MTGRAIHGPIGDQAPPQPDPDGRALLGVFAIIGIVSGGFVIANYSLYVSVGIVLVLGTYGLYEFGIQSIRRNGYFLNTSLKRRSRVKITQIASSDWQDTGKNP